jgi:hypothetical protein
MPEMSPPALNTPFAPVSTMQRVPSDCAASSRDSSSVRSGTARALRRSG